MPINCACCRLREVLEQAAKCDLRDLKVQCMETLLRVVDAENVLDLYPARAKH